MKKKIFRSLPLVVALPGMFVISAASAEEFNMQFVHGAANMNTAREVSVGDSIQPGTYPFDIYLNSEKIDSLSVTFIRNGNGVEPCFSAEQLHNYGIILPAPVAGQQCVDLKKLIPDGKVEPDITRQRIDLTIPQTSMTVVPKGSIPTRLWDEGVNAGFVNYNLDYSKNSYHGSSSASSNEYTYLSLSNGLNLGRWRLRENGNYTHDNTSGSHWNNISSWAETDIISMRSRFLVGQSSTSNNVFDSIQFRGVKLSSVDDMLPDSMRNYAPVVRGVASSNARVTIRQNGYLVYSTTVPPGPFAIHDIYPNTSGTLYVTVTEADGSSHQFTVAYSSVANMLREGLWNYEVTAGRYHDGTGGYNPDFIQGTVARGISHNLTPYGGVLIADNYQSAVAGIGSSLGAFGAVSLDGSYAKTNLASGGTKQGQSYRILYAKSLNELGTDFRLAGYRYSTSGYYDFNDAVQERREWKNGQYESDYIDPNDVATGTPGWAQTNNATYYSNVYANKRQRMEVSINQSLNGYGSIYMNANQQTYWGTSEKTRTVQVGYSNSWKGASYGVYWQSTRSQYGYSDNSVNVTLSIPLVINSNNNVIVSTTQLAHDQQSGDSYNTGVSGTLLDDNRLSYGVSTGHTESGGQNSSANLSYDGSKGNINGSYSYSSDYTQSSLGASGGLVVHSGGVTLSQPLGDTFVIVKAKDAQGVGVLNSPGVKVDRFGYAIVNNVTPYRYNTIALDTEQMRPGLDIPQSIIQTVPTEKAIVRVNFNTFYGHSLLIHSRLADNSFPQIGASVFNSQGRNSGTVGMNGDLYVAGIAAGDKLTVKWGDGPADKCYLQIPAKLDAQTKTMGYQELTLTCQRP